MKITFLGIHAWQPGELWGKDPLFRNAMPKILGPLTNNYEAYDVLYNTTPSDITPFSSLRSDKLNLVRLILKAISMPSKKDGHVSRFQNTWLIGHRIDADNQTTYEFSVKGKAEGGTILISNPDPQILDVMLASLRPMDLPFSFSLQRLNESKRLAEKSALSPQDREAAILKAIEAVTNSSSSKGYEKSLSGLYKRFHLESGKV